MKMRELERRTGVGRETVRYYIGLGLLPEPHRPKRNVANYGEEHVERLAAIRRLRDETWLPLSFIKTLLDRPSHGVMTPIPGFAALLAPRLGVQADGSPITLADAARLTGLSVEELGILIHGGVIFAASASDGACALAPLDMAVAAAWSRVRGAGFNPEAGFYAEDARLYADTIAPLSLREVERFFTRVTGGRSIEAAAALAQAGVEEVNALISAMRRNYILRRVAELTAAPTASTTTGPVRRAGSRA